MIEICINKVLFFGFKSKVSKVTYSWLTGTQKKETEFQLVGRDQKPEKPHGRCLRYYYLNLDSDVRLSAIITRLSHIININVLCRRTSCVILLCCNHNWISKYLLPEQKDEHSMKLGAKSLKRYKLSSLLL